MPTNNINTRSTPARAGSGSSISLPRSFALTAWQPVPVPQPEVDPDLPDLTAIERSAEVLRYSALRLEHAISPGGTLRAWLRLNVLLALLVGIPALFVVPVLTLLLSSLASWSGLLLQVTMNLLGILLSLAGVVTVVFLLVFIINRLRLSLRNWR